MNIQYNTKLLTTQHIEERNDRRKQQLIKTPPGRRLTIWPFTSAAEKLNQGLPE